MYSVGVKMWIAYFIAAYVLLRRLERIFSDRPQPPLGYTWATLMAICSVLAAMTNLAELFFAALAGNSIGFICLMFHVLLAGAAAAGIFCRKKYGVICLIISHLGLPALNTVAPPVSGYELPLEVILVLSVINAWYFAKRWQYLSVPESYAQSRLT